MLQEMFRGDTHVIALEFEDDAGDDLEVGGWIAWLTIKSGYSSTPAVEKMVNPVAAGNVIEFTIVPGDTEDLATGNYVYDIQTKDGDGVVKTVVAGNFVIKPDVTLSSEVA